jgi:murein DD-endopeptidase MepM/ murein hydrolase activator NlpD
MGHKQARGREADEAVPADKNLEIVAQRNGNRLSLYARLKDCSEVTITLSIYEPCANYVVVAHADGTFGEYLHLKHDGVLVKLGQHVSRHQVLALSGNTGRSTAPRRHVAVFYNIDGKTRKTIPTRFKVGNKVVPELKPGSSY